jgi:hypothetical protein
MTTIDKFSKFERDERVFREVRRFFFYFIAGAAISAIIGATAVTPSFLKRQCEAQALHNGADAKDCHWETIIKPTIDAPGLEGYLF